MKSVCLILSVVLVFGCSNHDRSAKTQDAAFGEFSAAGGWKGSWQRDCNDINDDITLPAEDGDFMMSITTNQIYIKARMHVAPKRNTARLTLVAPADLGAGGSALDWDDFSRDSAIAIMTMMSEGRAHLKWLGFYNKKTRKRFWQDGYDLTGNMPGHETDIVKCHADNTGE